MKHPKAFHAQWWCEFFATICHHFSPLSSSKGMHAEIAGFGLFLRLYLQVNNS